MIYSIIPIEDILRDLEKDKIKPYTELSVSGVSCYVEKLSDFEYKIIRIHSSDPNVYLTSGLQPGTIVNLKQNI